MVTRNNVKEETGVGLALDVGKRSQADLTFLTNLNYLLNANNYRKVDLAKGIGVSPVTVSNWCNGHRGPTAEMRRKIADFLGVDVQALYDPEGRGRSDANTVMRIVVPTLRVGANGTSTMDPTDFVPIPGSGRPTNAFVAPDDSMAPVVCKGDIVLFAPAKAGIRDGGMAVAKMQDGGYILRRLYLADGNMTFVASNPAYRPETYSMESAPEIMGVPLFVQRRIAED